MFNIEEIQSDIVKNTSKIYTDGSVWNSNQYGKFKIIGKSKTVGKYYIMFDDGTITLNEYNSIKAGAVENRNFPTTLKKGYLGYGKWKAAEYRKNTKEYCLWFGLLRRVYEEDSLNKFPTYRKCTIDERWHNFQNFCEDIQHLDGYNEWKNCKEKYMWELDKDIKQQGVENKIYSKDTCMFATKIENNNERTKRLFTTVYIGVRMSDEYYEEFTNQREFADKHGLDRRSINSCINKWQKSHKGWIFETKKIKNRGELDYDKQKNSKYRLHRRNMRGGFLCILRRN